jgi:hypothetical protein
MSNHIRMAEGWKQIVEAEMAQVAALVPQPTPTINISLTTKELTVLKSLIQSAVNEMTSDPNSGMKGIPKEISDIIKKLTSLGQ